MDDDNIMQATQQESDLHIEFAKIHMQKRDHPKLAMPEYIQALDLCTTRRHTSEEWFDIQERTFLKNEQTTWELLQHLTCDYETTTTMDIPKEKWLVNHLHIAQNLIAKDAELRKQLVPKKLIFFNTPSLFRCLCNGWKQQPMNAKNWIRLPLTHCRIRNMTKI